MITDITNGVKSYEDGTASLTILSTDYLYIGQRHPFNSLFFKPSTVNAEASLVTLKVYDGRNFVSVAELNDETLLSGASLGQSGFMTFVPDKDESNWSYDDTEDMTELSTIKIYDHYWIQLSFSASLTAPIVLKYIGNLFNTDNDLYAEYPIFSKTNMKSAFSVTTWEQQSVRAAEIIIQDMVADGIILNGGQLLSREKIRLAAICKVAELIFGALGDDYENDRIKARNEYKSRLSRGVYDVDINANAILDKQETKRITGFMSR